MCVCVCPSVCLLDRLVYKYMIHPIKLRDRERNITIVRKRAMKITIVKKRAMKTFGNLQKRDYHCFRYDRVVIEISLTL